MNRSKRNISYQNTKPMTFVEFMKYAEKTSEDFTTMLKNGIKHFFPDMYREMRMDSVIYTPVELVATLKVLGVDFQENEAAQQNAKATMQKNTTGVRQ